MMGFSGFGMKQKAARKLQAPKIVASAIENPRKELEINDVKDKIELEEKVNQRENEKLTKENNVSNLSDADEDDEELIPIAAVAQLKDHVRAVSAMTIDPRHSRLITAGRDYMVKFWDFHSMSHFLRPFHSFEPAEGNPVRDIAFNLTGGMFLVASNAARAKLFSRDGEELAEYMQGDPYLRDLRHTNGHTTTITSASWHPYDRPTFLTSSVDGTIRIWDCEKKEKQKEVIVVKTKERHSSTTCASYSHDAKVIAGASSDGGIRIYGSKGPFIVPSKHVQAHSPGSSITSLKFSRNGHDLLSRSMDGTIKLWDIRNFTKPVLTLDGIDSFYEESNAVFSPDGNQLIS